jgi:hypothetical protein
MFEYIEVNDDVLDLLICPRCDSAFLALPEVVDLFPWLVHAAANSSRKIARISIISLCTSGMRFVD